ncbi:MAG: bifunctional adenosylcobinamide kinase/adenosylcobinamide-phosphate guanylyltransferase [Ruminococcus sp.]|nr:bifunctional adenosylcobinamide kinase/adenosylcobinamide-phosphate guanylyltransferase [Ruminococcus sp.]
MMILITGGSKCGKSHYAESLFYNFDGQKFYIATMQPFGDEAQAAIRRHREMRRNKGFETIEKYTDTEDLQLPGGCGILLECMGNLCANEMFRSSVVCNPAEKILSGILHLKKIAALLIIVTNEVACDGISYECGTSAYIRVLNEINCRIAEMADHVMECVYGIPVALKGTIL